MTSASGSRRKAWWECPAKQVGNSTAPSINHPHNEKDNTGQGTNNLNSIIICSTLHFKYLYTCVRCLFCASSAVALFQHYSDFPVSVGWADQSARPHTCRNRLYDWSKFRFTGNTCTCNTYVTNLFAYWTCTFKFSFEWYNLFVPGMESEESL